MTESPWAAKAARPATVRKPANWGIYLLINLGLAVLVGIIDAGLSMALQFQIPPIISNIVVVVGSVWFAGDRWLKANDRVWTREDRHRLAFAYTMVNLVTTLVVLGIVVAIFAAGMGGELGPDLGITPDMMQMGMVFIAVVTAIVMPLVLWATYGIMRLVLHSIVNKNARPQGADVANEFN